MFAFLGGLEPSKRAIKDIEISDIPEILFYVLYIILYYYILYIYIYIYLLLIPSPDIFGTLAVLNSCLRNLHLVFTVLGLRCYECGAMNDGADSYLAVDGFKACQSLTVGLIYFNLISSPHDINQRLDIPTGFLFGPVQKDSNQQKNSKLEPTVQGFDKFSSKI